MIDTLIVHDLGDVVDTELTDPEYDRSHAHIVGPDLGPGGNVVKQGVAKVTEARVTGTPVEALCGFVWVPSKDARSLPVCSKCKHIADGGGRFDPDNLPSA